MPKYTTPTNKKSKEVFHWIHLESVLHIQQLPRVLHAGSSLDGASNIVWLLRHPYPMSAHVGFHVGDTGSVGFEVAFIT